MLKFLLKILTFNFLIEYLALTSKNNRFIIAVIIKTGQALGYFNNIGSVITGAEIICIIFAIFEKINFSYATTILENTDIGKDNAIFKVNINISFLASVYSYSDMVLLNIICTLKYKAIPISKVIRPIIQ